MPFATAWVKPEDAVLSEISQTEQERFCIVSITCGILKSQIRRSREYRVVTGGREVGEMGRCWLR